MNYKVQILRRALKELAGLSADDFDRVREGIEALAQSPRPLGCQKLSGREGWRIRVGNYRVIYEIDDKQRSVTVLHVGHRRDVYR
jgi:mRNA interferase RelE/StbE